MTSTDMDVIKDIPGYKIILKAVLKSQIQQLVEQLAAQTDEESIILTASVADGKLSHLGSDSGQSFLDDHEDIKSQFLGFCLRKYHKQKSFQKEQQDMYHLNTKVGSMSQSPKFVSPSNNSPHSTRVSPRGHLKSSGVRHEPYSVTRPGKQILYLDSTLKNSMHEEGNTSHKVEEPLLKQESGEEITTETEPVTDSRVSPSAATLSVSCASPSQLKSDLLEKNECISVNITNVETELECDNSNSSSNMVDNVSVKIEPLTEHEMELEITGIELSRSQDNWTSNLLMGMSFDRSSSSGSQTDTQTGQMGYNMDELGGLSNVGMSDGSPVRVFFCDLCGKPFPSKWELQRHHRTHTGEKPYQCNVCNKRFSDKSNLNQHVKGVHLKKPIRKRDMYDRYGNPKDVKTEEQQ